MTDKFENALCLKWLTLEDGQYFVFLPPIKPITGDDCPAVEVSEETGQRILAQALRDEAVVKSLSEPENCYLGWNISGRPNQYGRLMTPTEQQEAREKYGTLLDELHERHPNGRVVRQRPHQNRYVGWHGA